MATSASLQSGLPRAETPRRDRATASPLTKLEIASGRFADHIGPPVRTSRNPEKRSATAAPPARAQRTIASSR